MSPASRPRKKRKNNRRTPSRPGPQSLDSLLAKAVRSWQPLVTAGHPLEAEIFASEFLDILHDSGTVGSSASEPEPVLVFDVLDFAARVASPAAVALARGLAAVGTTDEQRALAHDVAEALVVTGLPDPAWGGVLGRPTPGRSWSISDAYGDASTVAIEFSYGEKRHLLLAWIDCNLLGGWAKDIFVTWEPDDTLATLRAAADSDDLLTVDETDPHHAAVLVRKAIAATDLMPGIEGDGTFRSYRALALARCRLFPETAGVGAYEGFAEVPEDERSRIASEFLSSEEARDLPAAAERCARWVIQYSEEQDHGRTLRVSPTKMADFLHGWLPDMAVLDAEHRAAVPDFARAWARWAAARTGLPAAATTELADAVDTLLHDYETAELGAAPTSTHRIKVSLRGAKPPIWRRLTVPSTTTLDRLHDVLQVAFDWEDYHLHSFQVAGRTYGPAASPTDPDVPADTHDEAAATLNDVAPDAKDKIGYEYDFGDSWEHDIVVEQVEPYDGTPYAVCLGGRRAGPLEDSGGIPGYAVLCAALENPDDPDHAERLAWLRDVHGDFDPAAFDKKTINERLATMPLVAS